MDIKQIYQEQTNKDIYSRRTKKNQPIFNDDYVKWLETQLKAAVVFNSLPNPDDFTFELTCRIEKHHENIDKLSKTYLQIGGQYAYKVMYDKMK